MIFLNPATMVLCVFTVVQCKYTGSGQELVQEHKVEKPQCS